MVSRLLLQRGIPVLGVLLAFSGAALASDRGSAEDQLACTPDVYRLCSSFVPDENAIVACLKKNVQGLSPQCRTVMTRPSAPTRAGGDEDED